MIDSPSSIEPANQHYESGRLELGLPNCRIYVIGKELVQEI
jgi:hypothetical protein